MSSVDKLEPYAIAKFSVIVVGLENAEDLVGSEKSKLPEEFWLSLLKRLRCSGLGDITEVLITILDKHSGSFAMLSGVFLSCSSTEVLSLQERFDGKGDVDPSGSLVCLMIAENAEDEFLCSRLRPSRGTITLVGEAVTHGVVCSLFKGDGRGVQDFVEDDVVF